MFQQGLLELVKSIRANRRDELMFMRAKHSECTEEARRSDPEVKATALLKLTYLQMFGFSFSSSSFQVIEVMSRPEFSLKRIGYFAATQGFSPTTDVLLLTTNQFKKDLAKGRQVDCSLALSCLAKICTEELGRDTCSDLEVLLSSARPYIRKKAILVMYKVALVFPEAMPILSGKLKERLTDSNASVVCTAVTVICEMAKLSPKSGLEYAPLLYELLTSSSSNWLRIKIVKLMGMLCTAEPLLGKKLVSPLSALLRKESAKSLVFECCNTITLGMIQHTSIVEVATRRLGDFITDDDQNLKFLGLVAMTRLAKLLPGAVQDHRDLILDCLNDEDVGVRMSALDLTTSFTTKRNFRENSRLLMRRLSKGIEDADRTVSGVVDTEGDFVAAIAARLLDIGRFKPASQDASGGYTFLTTEDDFSWYVTTILMGLAQTSVRAESNFPERKFSRSVARSLADQLVELSARVESVRMDILKCSLRILSIIRDHQVSNLSELVSATALIVGESSDLLTERVDVLEDLVAASDVTADHTEGSPAQLRIITSCLKVYATANPAEKEQLGGLIEERFDNFLRSADTGVRERAMETLALVKSRLPIAHLFQGRLRPLTGASQRRVNPPAGFDINQALATISDVETEEDDSDRFYAGEDGEAEKSATSVVEPASSSAGGGETTHWSKENDLFHLGARTLESQKRDDHLELLVNLTEGENKSTPEKGEMSRKAATVFVGDDELVPVTYSKDDYASLGTPRLEETGLVDVGEDTRPAEAGRQAAVSPKKEGAKSTRIRDEKKKKKKKKKKRKKEEEEEEEERREEPTARQDLLIDFTDDANEAEERKTSDVADFFS
eukprot:CAMPEP_0198737216 /NCGR_PEP_ID=MMETSP1475-20131203/67754_1 /TAXON_ID= ORGANISM="Unidentified sp., Strain CCMP1999" /NCGR_SAMPLE_ID=MMETSP1475 /ASSEMBLY_ACC=CAM_ASM_001111 /LENGTH=842 /DNA_ID=CAMNT_0044501075 /DNA_START=243 /DNA_END=2771 /DNA_ORIENTATION=-